jgi:hypothetical protein
MSKGGNYCFILNKEMNMKAILDSLDKFLNCF